MRQRVRAGLRNTVGMTMGDRVSFSVRNRMKLGVRLRVGIPVILR